jgi:aminoglycoside 3-N-acetyltransferase
MPTFTYKTMIIPENGPANNAITYGSGRSSNRMAEFFRPNMPADRLMGVVAEAFRQHPDSDRSKHPILSFTGVRANDALSAQTLKDPLAPIRVLAAEWGWVLLLGVGHSVNTSIHYGEKTAGRKQFIRWALTPQGINECPGFPGCSNGFQAIAPHLENVKRQVKVGKGIIQAFPLPALVTTTQKLINADPQALLCAQTDCGRCSAVRATVR